MTLILASSSQKMLIADDAISGDDLVYKSHCKVVPWQGGFLGLAGYAGRASTIIACAEQAETLIGLADMFESVVEGHECQSVDGLLLTAEGDLWLIDSMGVLAKLETDYGAIGSGSMAAMAIMAYTEGSALVTDVLEATAEVTQSVSSTYSMYLVGE